MDPDFIGKSTWILSIYIDELNITHNIRVSDSTIVSSLAIELVKKINLKYDWTEFWLWCPSQKIWLLPKSSSLFQFNVRSYSKIHFIRRFNVINIQLPDLQIRQILLDFSKSVWKTNQMLCKTFGIRHHEELSLQWRLLKKTDCDNTIPIPNRRRKSLSVSQQNIVQSNLNLRKQSTFNKTKSKRQITMFFPSSSLSNNNIHSNDKLPSPATLFSPISFFSIFESNFSQNENDSQYFESFENSKLSNSPKKSFLEATKNKDVIIYKTYKERSNIPYKWMISESTLMEQAIGDYSHVLLLLRYKYHSYYYLNEKYDEIRINQIFHQCVWSILSGETDCMTDEAYLLGCILYQVNKSIVPMNESINTLKSIVNIDKEIDTMLDKLHLELIGKCDDQLENIIDISGEITLIKYPKTIFSRYEKYSAILTQNGIKLYKLTKKIKSSECLFIIPIKGNEIRLDIRLTTIDKFILEVIMLKNNFDNYNNNTNNNNDSINNNNNICIKTKPKEVIEKFRLKFLNKQDFIRWATALRLLVKSLDFSLLSNYQYEYHVVTNIVDMKRPNPNLKLTIINEEDENINLTDLVGPKFNKPFKRKEITEKIIHFNKAFKHYNTVQAKIAYIKCWLTISNAGVAYFQVRINKKKDLEIIGIGYNRIILADIDLGTINQSFEMINIEQFDTNWELNYSSLEFRDAKLRLDFKNDCDCQMFHEYIGGYLFIMMRNSEKYNDLSEKIFRNMTAKNLATI